MSWRGVTHRWMLVVGFVLTGRVVGQEPPGRDLAQGVVDPYESGKHRVAFFKVVGVDNELSAQEFSTDEQGPRHFVKVFDRWPAMLEFDRNKNTTLDWFEANDYRQDVRVRMMGKFDTDKDRRLTGEERVKANEVLAKGAIPPRVAAAGAGVAAPNTPPVNNKPSASTDPASDTRSEQERFVDGIMNVTDDEVDFNNMQEQMVKHFDTNGDGTLDAGENVEYGRVMQQRMLTHFDTNGDGVIDALEEVHQLDRMQDVGVRRAGKQFERFYDLNKDGTLDDSEKEQMEKTTRGMREQLEGAQAQRLRKYDKDGSGDLSLSEAQAIRDARMARGQRMQEFMAKHFDLDGSGQMDTKEEFEAMQKHQMASQQRGYGFGSPSAEMVKRFDEDGDGKLIGEELEEMMTQLMIENPPEKK